MKNKKNGFIKLIMSLLLVIVSVTSGYFLYTLFRISNIENIGRLIVSIIVILLLIAEILVGLRRIKKKKHMGKNITYILITAIYSLVLFLLAFNVDKIMSKISNVTSDATTYTSVLVTSAENDISSLDGIDANDKIAILNDENSYTGYIIPKEVISKYNLKNDIDEYDSFVGMLQDLLDGKIKYIFLPDNYTISFSNIDGLKNLDDKTKVIFSESKKVKEENTSSSSKTALTEPFTILLMGVDSTEEGIEGAAFNGDSLIVITFNPQTLSSTIVSIPRDTYTNITCFSEQRKNKITHAAWYGENCMIATIEKLLDTDIDYYVKINFKGVVDLVEALGGVEVDVPYAFCEQNSKRKWRNSTIYVEQGLQTLNGEQALAFARNRHPNYDKCDAKYTNYDADDFTRGQNQQQIIKAIINKLKNVKSVDTFYEILDAISNNMQTNLNTQEILSLYNVAKKAMSVASDDNGADAMNMKRLYISGYSAMIYDYSQKTGQGTKYVLYNYVPYTGSLNDVSNAMKSNLETNNSSDAVKSFSFNVNTPYKEAVVGKGYYNEAGISLLDDMTGMSEADAVAYLNKTGLSNSVKYVTSGGANGTVVEQSIPAQADLTYVQSVVLSVVKSSSNSGGTTIIDCTDKKNSESDLCAVPNFADGNTTYSYADKWISNRNLDKVITYVESTDKELCAKNEGLVVEQSYKSGYFYDYINKGFTITYCPVAQKQEDSSTNTDDSKEDSNKDSNKKTDE